MTLTDSSPQTMILNDRSTDASHSINSLSVPETDTITTMGVGTSVPSVAQPTETRSEPVGLSPQDSTGLAPVGIAMVAQSIEGDVI